LEVVANAWIFKLVDLIEDDDRSRAVMLLEPVDESVVRRRLAVNIDGCAELVENLVGSTEPSVVAPAVDVDCLDVEGTIQMLTRYRRESITPTTTIAGSSSRWTTNSLHSVNYPPLLRSGSKDPLAL